MDQSIEFLTRQDPNWGTIIFLMAMSVFIAIFHTVIFALLFNFTFNKKLFFFANPLIISSCALVDTRWGLAAFLIIFASVFLFAFIGILAAGFRNEEKTEREKFYFQYHRTPPSKTRKHFLQIIFLVCIGCSYFYIGYYCLLIAFIFLLAIGIFMPTNKSRFLKYQTVLPVSKIRSLAMGLVEVEGKLIMTSPLKAPLSGDDCIGFHYTIETISSDDNGRDSYSTIFSETICNDFLIEDETGSIKVNANNIEWFWVKSHTEERNNSKRYTEYIIRHGDPMLLIGTASVEMNNTPVIQYDNFRKVLAMAPPTEVKSFNVYKPFRHAFIFYSCIYLILIALVLVSPVEIQSNQIIIKMPDWKILNSSTTEETAP
jgi:hypothetical protein